MVVVVMTVVGGGGGGGGGGKGGGGVVVVVVVAAAAAAVPGVAVAAAARGAAERHQCRSTRYKEQPEEPVGAERLGLKCPERPQKTPRGSGDLVSRFVRDLNRGHFLRRFLGVLSLVLDPKTERITGLRM